MIRIILYAMIHVQVMKAIISSAIINKNYIQNSRTIDHSPDTDNSYNPRNQVCLSAYWVTF